MNQHPDYENVLHKRENNSESEAHLKANKYHFTGQCAVLLSLLQKGVVITSLNAMLDYKIGDVRRRLKDLRDAGVQISEDWVMDEQGKKTRYKKWYIDSPGNLYAPGTKTVSDFARELINSTQGKLL